MKVTAFITLVVVSCFRVVSSTYLSSLENSTDDFQEAFDSVNHLADALNSPTCQLDFDDETAVSPSDDRYDLYYRFCKVFCGCDPDRGHRQLINKGKTVVAQGECNNVVSALKDATTKTQDGGYFDLFHNDHTSVVEFFCDINDGVCASQCTPSEKQIQSLDKDENQRQLEEIALMSTEDILNEIAQHNANPNGIYSKKKDGLSKKACDSAINYLDTTEYERTLGRYNRKLTGEKLVDIIGKEEAKLLLDFFHESLGREAIVTNIKIQRPNYENHGVMTFTPHVDNVDSMFINLRDNGSDKELSGGGIYHYSENGLLTSEKVTQGHVVVQGGDVLHKTYHWSGKRDGLVIESDPKKKDKTCMLWDLVH